MIVSGARRILIRESAFVIMIIIICAFDVAHHKCKANFSIEMEWTIQFNYLYSQQYCYRCLVDAEPHLGESHVCV